MSFSFLYPTALYALLLLPLLLALPFVGRLGGLSKRATSGKPFHVFRFSFWLALAVRALILLALILGLAGTQVVQAVQDLTVVFVVDHSDSVPQTEQKRAEEFIRASLASMKHGDRAAVVVFGENALIERLASEEPTLATIASVPRTAHTNIASALRLALALFPEGTQKRIVLLSDGVENAGRAAEVAELAVARGAQIDVVSLNPPIGQAEAYLDTLEAPSAVRKGQAFEIVAVVRSTSVGAATVRLFGDGKLIATRDLNLQAGNNRISFSLTADQPGFHRYTAELQAANDTLPQNNLASAFSVVHGPPRVLVVENSSGDADNLVAALKAANIESELIAPSALPGDLTALSNYDAVFLVNVPAKALSDAAMLALPSYVRDLGRGLVMIGGPDSYGAGGYLRTPVEKALPVDMDVRSRKQEPNLALVFVIDKSGSMGRCHCDDPNGRDMRVESGLPKIDIAKDAVMQATRALGRADFIGVVAFDANALWAVRVQEFTDSASIQQKIGGLRAEGQTNIFAGLSEAEVALAKTSARIKHVILLTDGWSRSGNFDELAQKMMDEGITLSVVAAGNGSAIYLRQLARSGGGRYYAATNMSEVPSLFFKETVEAAGSYIVEEPFYPLPASTTPILRGLDVTRLPALHGYNGTTPKTSAQVALLSQQGDPLLATWQYGLGRAVAWTSDAKGQWASEWVKWDGFNTFVAQMTNWVLPQTADEGLQITFTSEGDQSLMEVTSRDAAGRPRDLLDTRATIAGADSGQSLVSQAITLTQVAPGRYRAPWSVPQPGTYLVQVTQQDAGGTPIASATTGLIVPYSPEYKIELPGLRSVLPQLARATGGQEIAEPALALAPLAKPATRAQPIWPMLLLMAALLFPLDVAARRLRGLQISDFKLVLSAAEGLQIFSTIRNPKSAIQPSHRALASLFAARSRARRVVSWSDGQMVNGSGRQEGASSSDRAPSRAPDHATTQPSDHMTTRPNDQVTTSETMTERLKKAKERARKTRPEQSRRAR